MYCGIVCLYRHPSEHFCGTTAAHHQLPVNKQDLHGLQHDPFLAPSSNQIVQFHEQKFQKSKYNHRSGVSDESLAWNEREKDRLKKRQASTVVKDSCPMELVATHSFVQTYGREGIGDVVQYLVSQDVM